MCFDRRVGGEADEVFEEIVGELDYPMLIVTAAAGDELAGCLVGFATQTSISPPRFLVCLSRKNRTYRVARTAPALGVHFLTADADDLAELFGGETGDEVDKFDRVEWTAGPHGTPLVERCRNRFVGRVLERLPAGDHTAFLLEPIAAEQGESVRPFPFHRAKRIDPGHEA
jgi:flavin reductase (DIM6/NTAB) family NADH-FMN oxidoreductase RutF